MRNEREIAREAKINNKAASKHKRNKRSVQEPMGSLKAARGNLLTEYEDIAKNIKRLFFPLLPFFCRRRWGHMPEWTSISQEWKEDLLKEIKIVSARVTKKLGHQKNCLKSRAWPQSPEMRGPEASEGKGSMRL